MERNGRGWLVQVRAAIRLMRLPGVGAATFRRLMRVFGSPVRAWKAVCREELKDRGFDLPRTTVKRPTPELTERACNALGAFQRGEGGTWFGATDYPWRLRRIPEPPPVLFYRGIHRLLLPRHDDWSVAIVGAREATDAGRSAARLLAAAIVAEGGVVISGLAAGIDAAAHEAALDAGGGTIGVVATGVDVPYPPATADLWRLIGRKGLIVSEFFPGTPPVRSHFPTRNRIIAGLADAVVFIEGTARSGGLITVAKARAMKRPCLALGGGSLHTEGARSLVEKGWLTDLDPHPHALLERLRAVRESLPSRKMARQAEIPHHSRFEDGKKASDLLQ